MLAGLFEHFMKVIVSTVEGYFADHIQSVGQFYDLYGGRDKSDVFFQNTDYKIVCRQNTKIDRDFVSEMLGNCPVKNRSRSFQPSAVGLMHAWSSESYIFKPLLSYD